VGSAIVMLALVKIVPEMIQALINRAAVGSSPLLASAAAIAGGAAVVGGGAYGAGMVVRSAGRLASEQLADARFNGTAAPTAFGRGVQFTAAAAGNIARAAVENRRPLERAGAFRDAARPDVRGAGTQGRGPRGGARRAPDLPVPVFALMFTVASVSNLAFDDRS
jgi:hypothetical protein